MLKYLYVIILWITFAFTSRFYVIVHSNSIIFFKLARHYYSCHVQIIIEGSTERKVFHSVTVVKSSTSTKSHNRDLCTFPSSLNSAIEVNVKSSSSKMRYFDRRVGDIFSENVAVIEKRKWCNNAVVLASCRTIITVTVFTILDLNHHQIAPWHMTGVAFPFHVWTTVWLSFRYISMSFSKWTFYKSVPYIRSLFTYSFQWFVSTLCA